MKRSLLRVLSACALGSLSFGQVQAYLVDTTLDQLFTVDLSTGAATFLVSVANNGLSTAADLTWKSDTQELWTVDLSGGEAGTIDPATGTFTPVFQTNLSGWQGMAWDPNTQLFYLANQDDNNYTLDPATGLTTLLGNSGFDLITALDVDANGVLWGVDFFTPNVVTINKATGVGTMVSMTSPGFQGLGIDLASGTFYGSNTNDDSLHFIDPASGTATLIGAHGAGVTFAKGFDLVDDFCAGARLLRSGTGCSDASGVTLSMMSGGAPCIGQTLDLGSNTTATFYYLVMGLSDQNWLGLALPLDLTPFGGNGCSIYCSQEAVIGPAQGGIPVSLPIPNNGSIVGATAYWQHFVIDPTIPRTLPLASSDLLQVTIGQ